MKKLTKAHHRIAILVGIAVLLAGVVFFLRGGTEFFRATGYDATAPTSVKFARMARWLPPGAEFDVTIDVSRALAQPAFAERLAALVAGHTGVAAELIAALLQNQGSVGMIAVTGTFGSAETLPLVVVLAQGNFDQRVVLPAVRAAMAAGRAGLTSQDLGWATLFSESDERSPFGFILLDGRHIAVGSREALEAFYSQEPVVPENASIGRLSDATLFGHALVGPRVRGLIPAHITLPESIDFSSADDGTIQARFPCASPDQALSLRLFMEGVRSLILLQQEANIPLVTVLKGFSIESANSEVVVASGLAPLIDLWAAIPSGEEGDEATLPYVQQAPVRQP